MTPTAAHIAAAMKIDRYLAREVDISMALIDGWISIGRWRAMPDEEETDGSPNEGFWACFSYDHDADSMEAEGTIAVVADPRRIFESVLSIYGGLSAPNGDDSITQLLLSMCRMIEIPQTVGRCSMYYTGESDEILVGQKQCAIYNADKMETLGESE